MPDSAAPLLSAWMLRVVTTNNVEVFRHLGAGPFQRLDVEHTIATTFAETLEKVRAVKPRLAIIDAELAGGNGFDLCSAIKADPTLSDVHVMLVLASFISREAITELESCGCDDVLAVPIHADDFYHHIAQIAGLPLRRDRRIGAALQLHLPGADGALIGEVDNISTGGAGIVVEGEVPVGQHVAATIVHDGAQYPDLRARVVWARPGVGDEAGYTSAGLEFDEVPMKTRLLLERLCLYDISRSPEGGVTVSLYGDITEMTDFSALAGRLQSEPQIDFYMRGVRYISSAGVRSWCEFLGTVADKRYRFRHCSMAFASQAAMVPSAVGAGTIESVDAPYFCDRCDREELRLLEVRAVLRDGDDIVPPVLNCTQCDSPLEFDDVPSRYFAFLTAHSPAEDDQ